MPKTSISEFVDKTVIVTGGSRGIGLCTARSFLDHGASVAICAIHGERLQQAVTELGRSDRLLAEVADVSDVAAVDRFVDNVYRRFGRIDVLVNNAGILYAGPFVAQPLASISAVIDVNVKGLLITARRVLPHMLDRRDGVIINVSSGAGLSGFGGIAVYCASKFAVVGFTESLDQEVRDQGIRVYGICPGRVATDMQRQFSGRPIGMPPERVATRIVGLAGSHPQARTGRCLTIG